MIIILEKMSYKHTYTSNGQIYYYKDGKRISKKDVPKEYLEKEKTKKEKTKKETKDVKTKKETKDVKTKEEKTQEENISDNLSKASKGRFVYDISLFDSSDPDEWEEAYKETMDPKYAKGTRNFSRYVSGKEWKFKGDPPIYLIPRRRGKAYKNFDLKIGEADDLFYAPISKGFPMQNISSFTIGPIVGEGLCLVNAAFSKNIYLYHIEGGKVDLSKGNFWKSNKPSEKRDVEFIDNNHIKVNGKTYETIKWLKDNEKKWLPEWEKWRKSVALASIGDFHWCGNSEIISYRYKDKYLSFVEWKKECYIKPSYELLPKTDVFKFLNKVWKEEKYPLGLVHPMASGEETLEPLTKEYIKKLFDSKCHMACQPYVVVGKLLDVKID